MQSLDTVSEDLVDSITALREQVCGDWGVLYCKGPSPYKNTIRSSLGSSVWVVFLGSLLVVFWSSFGRLLDFGSHLVVFWLSFGRLLDFDRLLVVFWPSFDCLFSQFWSSFCKERAFCNCVAVSSLTLISILKLYLNYIKQSSYTVVISFCQILFNLLVVYGLHEQYIYYHVKRGYRLIDQPG